MCNKEVSRFKVTRDNLQRRFLAQHSVVSWLQQRCVALKIVVANRSVYIATLCCAKNRRCESFRVCYTKQFAMTIFSATQHHNIVSNGCNIVPTLECCVALKIVLVNRLV